MQRFGDLSFDQTFVASGERAAGLNPAARVLRFIVPHDGDVVMHRLAQLDAEAWPVDHHSEAAEMPA